MNPIQRTKFHTVWNWRQPRAWLWASYTSPGSTYVIKWRGPRVTSAFTYYDVGGMIEHYPGDGCYPEEDHLR